MPDYSQGKIYQIWSPQTDKVYIGSTTNTLARRLWGHRAAGKKEYGAPTSKNILEFEDAKIELIEEYACENKMQLTRREGEVIRATPNCVNKFVPLRTREEREEENKEAIVAQRKLHYQENKEAYTARKRSHYQKNKGKEAARGKEYRENNKESIAERMKEYRQRPEVKAKHAEQERERRRKQKEGMKNILVNSNNE